MKVLKVNLQPPGRPVMERGTRRHKPGASLSLACCVAFGKSPGLSRSKWSQAEARQRTSENPFQPAS